MKSFEKLISGDIPLTKALCIIETITLNLIREKQNLNCEEYETATEAITTLKNASLLIVNAHTKIKEL